jgi:hypothetical protein
LEPKPLFSKALGRYSCIDLVDDIKILQFLEVLAPSTLLTSNNLQLSACEVVPMVLLQFAVRIAYANPAI